MKLYLISETGYFNGTIEVPDDPGNVNGIPYGSTRKEVPAIPDGMYCIWNGTGWDLTPIPPTLPIDNEVVIEETVTE